MGSLEKRIEALEGRIRPPESPRAAARRERVIRALDRIGLLRIRQGVAVDELVLETEEDREAWAVFEPLRERIERDGK